MNHIPEMLVFAVGLPFITGLAVARGKGEDWLFALLIGAVWAVVGFIALAVAFGIYDAWGVLL